MSPDTLEFVKMTATCLGGRMFGREEINRDRDQPDVPLEWEHLHGMAVAGQNGYCVYFFFQTEDRLEKFRDRILLSNRMWDLDRWMIRESKICPIKS